MPHRLRTTVALTAAFVLGCATTAAVQSTMPNANANAGARKCFASTLWYVQGKQLNQGVIPDTVAIPPGWEVVGGGAHPGGGMVIVCSAQAS